MKYEWKTMSDPQRVMPPSWLWKQVGRNDDAWFRRCVSIILNIPVYVAHDIHRDWVRDAPDEIWVAFSSIRVER